MTSHTGEETLKYRTALKPQSFTTVILGTTVQILTLAYVWYEYSDFKMEIEDSWFRQIMIASSVCIATWIASILIGWSKGETSDPSITDRLWSLLPPIYVFLCYRYEKDSSRLFAMTALSSTWSLRLTWNFWRKGGFSGGEDCT